MKRAALLLAGLAACHGHTDVDETGPDVIVDTDPDGETGDMGPAPSWELALSPDDLAVGVGAELLLVLRGVSPEGEHLSPEARWTTTDPGVLEVAADGTVRAVAAGTAEVVAEVDGDEARARVQVDGEGTLRVEARADGVALADAHVFLGDAELGLTGGDGVLVVTGIPGEAAVVSVLHAGYTGVSLLGVVGRELVVELPPLVTDDVPRVGTVDLSVVDASPGDLAVALAGTELPESPWAVRWDDLVGPARAVTVLGVDVDLPANLVIDGYADTWEIAGSGRSWALAGALPLSEALAAGAGESDPVALLAAHLDGAWAGSTDGVDVPLDTRISEAVAVSWPALPVGVEAPLLLPLDGRVPVGIGVGGPDVGAVPGAPTEVLALAQSGGLGVGGGTSIGWAPVVDGAAALGDWAPIPVLPTVHVESGEVSLDGDGLVRGLVRDRAGAVRWVTAPGAGRYLLPELPDGLRRGRTTWELEVLLLGDGSFEERLQDGTAAAWGDAVVGSSFVSGEVAATAD